MDQEFLGNLIKKAQQNQVDVENDNLESVVIEDLLAGLAKLIRGNLSLYSPALYQSSRANPIEPINNVEYVPGCTSIAGHYLFDLNSRFGIKRPKTIPVPKLGTKLKEPLYMWISYIHKPTATGCRPEFSRFLVFDSYGKVVNFYIRSELGPAFIPQQDEEERKYLLPQYVESLLRSLENGELQTLKELSRSQQSMTFTHVCLRNSKYGPIPCILLSSVDTDDGILSGFCENCDLSCGEYTTLSKCQLKQMYDLRLPFYDNSPGFRPFPNGFPDDDDDDATEIEQVSGQSNRPVTEKRTRSSGRGERKRNKTNTEGNKERKRIKTNIDRD